MGTWGTGLYSDDDACDIRDEYKEILGEGISEPEATQQLLVKWKDDLSDPDVFSVFWLTLADVQWNLGRLQEQVKQEALLIIENGSDLLRWKSDRKDEAKRKAVLEKLHEKLVAVQPVEKKVKKRYVCSTDWELGDVYLLQLQSGKYALLHVIGFHQDKAGIGPVCEILEWSGEYIPDRRALKRMKYLMAKQPYQHLSLFLFASLGPKDFYKERVLLIEQKLPPKQKISTYSVIHWRSVDKQFEQLFDL